MVSLKGRPILEHTLLRMAEAALSELVVMFGYKAIEIIKHFGARYGNKRIRYVIQKDQKGLVHDIGCAKEVFEGENFSGPLRRGVDRCPLRRYNLIF